MRLKGLVLMLHVPRGFVVERRAPPRSRPNNNLFLIAESLDLKASRGPGAGGLLEVPGGAYASIDFPQRHAEAVVGILNPLWKYSNHPEVHILTILRVLLQPLLGSSSYHPDGHNLNSLMGAKLLLCKRVDSLAKLQCRAGP